MWRILLAISLLGWTLVARAKVYVEIDNVGTFPLIAFPGEEIEVIEYRNGDAPLLRKRPGRTGYSNLVISEAKHPADNAVSRNRALGNWFDTTRKGAASRRGLSIVVTDARGVGVRRICYSGTFPASRTFDRTGSHRIYEIAIEQESRCRVPARK